MLFRSNLRSSFKKSKNKKDVLIRTPTKTQQQISRLRGLLYFGQDLGSVALFYHFHFLFPISFSLVGFHCKKRVDRLNMDEK